MISASTNVSSPFSGDHFVKIIKRLNIDAMVGNAALRKVVGPDALRAVAGTDLRLARFHRSEALRAFQIVRYALEDVLLPIADFDAAIFPPTMTMRVSQMRQADGAIGFIHVLTAGAAAIVSIRMSSGHVDIDVFRFGQDRDGCRGGVHAPAGFRRRNVLHPMYAGSRISGAETRPARCDRFPTSAKIVFRRRNDFRFPASEIGIPGIHGEEIAARSAAPPPCPHGLLRMALFSSAASFGRSAGNCFSSDAMRSLSAVRSA